MKVWILWDDNTAANDCGHTTLLGIFLTQEEAQRNMTNEYMDYWLEEYKINTKYRGHR